MELAVWQTTLLSLLIAIVLFLPLTVHKVEENLEAFLFLCGIIAVSVSKMWSGHLVLTALEDPIKITLAVLIAGLLFRKFNVHLQKLTHRNTHIHPEVMPRGLHQPAPWYYLLSCYKRWNIFYSSYHVPLVSCYFYASYY